MSKTFLASKWEWFSFTPPFRRQMIEEIIARSPGNTFSTVRETIESVVSSKLDPVLNEYNGFTRRIWMLYCQVLEEIDAC
jgi:hypothetical protein